MDKVFIKYFPTTESERILHTIHGIATGFYIENGWYVLPNLKKFAKFQASVLLPNLDYKTILGSYKNIINIDKYNDNSNKAVLNKVWLKAIETEITEKKIFQAISHAKLLKLETQYSQILTPALKQLKQSIPMYKNVNFNICIKPTNFGVYLSFDSIKAIELKKGQVDIGITIRTDQPAEYILEGLASSVIRNLLESTNTWRETEAVSDFITKYMFEAKNFKGTILSVMKRDDTLLQASINYLITLHAPINLPLTFNADQNLISYFGQNITGHFSPYEFRVLKALIINRNRAVTFDYLSDQIYKDNSDLKFTLWGITKTVQRVRDKLEQLGVSRDVVQNVKGEGFKLLG